MQPFILEHGITYPVGLSGDYQSGYGGGGIPHAYLIGPDGEVIWHGHPASLRDDDVEKACRRAKDFYLRKVVPALKSAASAFEKGKLSDAKSLATAAKEKGGGDREVDADADYILKRVDEMIAFWKSAIEKATAEGQYADVFDLLDMIQKHYPGTEEATAAAAQEKELKADPGVKRELDAWKALDKIIDQARRAEGDERKLKSVVRKLEKFVEKYTTAKATKRAQQLLDSLQKKGH